MQSDKQVRGTVHQSYASLAAPADLDPTYDKGLGSGPTTTSDREWPFPLSLRAVVVHGVSYRSSMAEILCQAKQIRTSATTRVVAIKWLVGINWRKGKVAICILVYFNDVVPVRGCMVRFRG